MTGGEVWYNTFESVLVSGNRDLIIHSVDQLIKESEQKGMIRAAMVSAGYDLQSEEGDILARLIAREILQEAQRL